MMMQTDPIVQSITSVAILGKHLLDLYMSPSKKGEEFLSEPPPVAMSAAHESPNCTSASIKDTETWEKNKKFTVYKVAVSRGNASWFIFRRYNEFSKLCEVAKKQAPHLQLKMPGKKLFGSNMDPKLVEARREALDDFIQKVTSDERLMHTREVIEFFQLDQKHVENCVKTEDTQSTDDCDSGKGSYKGSNSSGASTELENKPPSPVNLGHTERRHVKPSHFEFLKVIGKGSFGKVLLARHREEEKFYAIKVLQKTLIVKRNETKHIMSERNVLLQNIKHPFLVGLHYSFQTTDKLYFVLDYINGGELFFHLQKERSFSESRARFYSAEISSALGYLHSRQIIYRDLKPENLLLDQQGHVILTDFGLCKEGLRDSDTTDTFCGTPEYLAPEVIRKQAYDRSVDWWCLGAVLYEMLYGLPPFYNKNTSTMYQNILYKPLKLRPTVSENARNILEKLLQKESQNRLGSGKNDVLDIQKHPFYKNINWDDLINKKIPPPFNPNVNGSMDLKNIDPEFTKEPVPASVGRSQNGTVLSASVLEADAAFEGFSYAPPLEDFF
ncbi:serine/threonine-protein kinase Sgk1-like isoform X1 [Cloeon dipterum]|uniref:serine/threonine-protein kinase Sgk1-like isoform X1 n=1 Tax=Cloeon dipterum TaxID=197152 RepID=UPI00321F6422